jgi:hypothetical protein
VATRWLTGAVAGIIALACATIALGTQEPPDGVLGLLVQGSAQVVLSVALLAVTAALGIAFKLLVKAYQDRIDALERAVTQSATSAAAAATLAAAMDRLREHCEGRSRQP